MRRITIALLALGAAGLFLPSGASAATCSDHPNQASAQRAKDTRDADGDGVYCETLPCPCARPGTSGGGGAKKPKPRRRPLKRAQRIDARITSVVDGDTVRVRAFGARRSYYTVRLIGIDTPETRHPESGVECGGVRATGQMLGLAFSASSDADGDGILDTAGGDGRRVTLTTDPTQDTYDAYGRLLAYVTTKAGTNLQVALLQAGWAKVYVFKRPFRRLGQFRAAERRARRGSRGAWSLCDGDFHRRL